MAIADTISSMYENVGEVYDTITNVDVNTGKNLFNKDTITKSSYLKEDGTLLTGTASEYNTSDFIPVEPNTAYYKTQTLSPRTKFYDANKQALNTTTYQDVSIGGNAGTFTTPSNAYYFRFTINTNPTTGANINLAMVNKGTTALPYEPYTDNPTYKNIENIPKVIRNSYLEIMNNGTDKIWNNWEKVTGSGTDISLSPTLEAPMKNVLNGNTYQFTTTGKNQFPTNFLPKSEYGITISKNANGDIVLNGTPNYSEGYKTFYTGDVITVSPGTYTLSVANKMSGIGVVVGGFSGGANLTLIDTVTSKTAYADTNQNVNPAINIRHDVGTLTNYVLNPMFEKSSTPTTYEPYTNGASPNPDYPQDIHVVSGDNTIKVVEKNLLDLSSFTTYTSGGVTFTNNNGIISATGTPTSTSWNKKVQITLKPGTYTFSGVSNLNTDGLRLELYRNNNDRYTIRKNDGTKTFTITEEKIYDLVIWVQSTSDFPTGNVILTPMIERNSSATEWEPYSSDSYPINLGVVNLFDDDTTTNVLIADDGTEQANTNVKTSTYIKVNPNNKYTFSCDIVQGQSRAWEKISYYDENQNYLSFLYAVDKVKTITLPTNCEYVRVGYHTNFATNVQFEVGSKANSYTPYGTTPIELCDLNTYKDNFLRTSGKNLYDGLYTAKRYINYNTGEMRNSDDWSATDYIEIEPNTSYTLSGITNSGWVAGTSFYDNSKTFISSVYSTAYTFTTPSNAKYLRLSLNSETPINIMLNEGSTALSYEPYGSGEWYTHKEIGKVVLNGSESGWHTSSLSVTGYKSYYVDSSVRINQDATGSKCNYFEYKTFNEWQSLLQATFIENTYQAIGIRVVETLAPTLEDFKNWLSTHNTIAYFVLATPTNTKITDSSLLSQLEAFYNAKSKNSQTNITQENNDLPFIISASALKEWQESASLNSTLSMVNPLSLGNTLNTQENNTQPIEVDNIEPLEEEENEES